MQQVHAVHAFARIVEQAGTILRTDQLREQVKVAAKIEYMRVGCEHDVREMGLVVSDILGNGVDGLLGEQSQFPQQPRRETWAVSGVSERLLGVHETPVGAVRGILLDPDRGQGDIPMERFDVTHGSPLE
jgi:hypothetical protein